MATFPDSLPPENLDIFYKYVLYFSIIYILSTAITARLITRKRVKSVKKGDTKPLVEKIDSKSIEEDIFDFLSEQERTAGLLVQIVSTQTAIDELGKLKETDKISDDAFLLLNTKFSETLEQLSSMVDSLPPLAIEDLEIVDDGLTVEVESKNDNQFLDDLGLDDDDDDEFLKPKEGIPRATAPSSPKPVAPKSFTAPKPAAPTAPKPVVPKSFAAPKPAAPTAPKPVVPKSFATPKPAAPTAPKPATPKIFSPQKPSSAPQPMSPQLPKGIDGDEKIFAKSTSIAAIRMDMLRELARLKKLINEDE